MTRIVVTIDGPAGAGKSTLTKCLASHLDYALLDTGALYRAVALLARESGMDWTAEQGLATLAAGLDVRFAWDGETNHVLVGDRDVTTAIRTPAISDGASRVSALPEVRRALLDSQRRIGRAGGVVAEGRDMGTVVFPGAPAKFFLTASAQVRAQRRCDELVSAGLEVDYPATLAEIVERDERDSSRQVAPLRPAADAIVLDSTDQSVQELVDQMLRVVRERESSA